MLARVLAVLFVAALGWPGAASAISPADGVVRYVTPTGGSISEDDCDAQNKCELEYAIEVIASDYDTVLLDPGSYTSNPIASGRTGVTIAGAPGASRPTVQINPSLGEHAMTLGSSATVRHLEIASGQVAAATVLLTTSGLIEDAVVTASGTATTALEIDGPGATVRSTLVRATGNDSSAIRARDGLNFVRNVTAIASGAGNSIAIEAFSDTSATPTTLFVRNTIARASGDRSDIVSHTESGTSPSKVDIAFSNYRTATGAAAAGGVPPGEVSEGEGNQKTSDPAFANAAAGDYHQLPGSVTINAGQTLAENGPVDFDGQARAIGPSTDIGADEAPDPDDDRVFDPADNCPSNANAGQENSDARGAGDACNADADGDERDDDADNCPGAVNVDQANFDGDAQGDACDPDDDNDGTPDASDPRPFDSLIPVRPTSGHDTLNGTAGPDLICGLAGNDTINGLQGNDTLFGDACDDTQRAIFPAQATDGNDELSGSEGDDKLYGAGGRDRLDGGAGNDQLFGGGGNDSLTGAAGNDKLRGDSGNDKLNGGAGRDALDGGSGNDKLNGGASRNSYKGGSGNDSIAAANGQRETVDCGRGSKDVARVDRTDKVRGCEKVKRAR